MLQICAYGASDQAAFAALFKLIRYPISPEIAQCWLEGMCIVAKPAPASRFMPSAARAIRRSGNLRVVPMPILRNTTSL